ncbi:GPO family capsid scaffolding protein [Methylophilus sp. 3sh_L]|uniref:GPO family capsid scaffolding protein n=1 Tax=Methylophilus sp. 3sh_L TaxID=3377114 RepID=UPI00398F2D9E
MPKLSQFIGIITEGDTTDGREVTAQMIEEAAETYNPDTYTARINIEHIRTLSPDSSFKMQGDVKAVRVGEKMIFGQKKKTLEAQLLCDDPMIQMATKDRQKIFFSAELWPNFAKTGKFYLSGLAMTDNPASLGTEVLKFASTAKVNPFSTRKSDPSAMIVAAVEAEPLQFSDAPAPANTVEQTNFAQELLTGLAALFKKNEQAPEPKPETKPAQTETFDPQKFTQELTTGLAKTFGDLMNKQSETITALQTSVNKVTKDFNDMKDALDKQPAGGQRAPAAGTSTDYEKTDC